MDIIIYPLNKHYKSLIMSKVTNNIDLGDRPITQTYDKIVIFISIPDIRDRGRDEHNDTP